GVSRVDFSEFPLPMDALASYAGWESQARYEGGNARTISIRSLLAEFDKRAATCADKIILPLPAGQQGCSYSPAWTKSALFFFALEDKIGRTQFHAALKYMIQARRSRSFSLADLISASEAESNESIGPFVRMWLKHSTIPEEFRSRYSDSVAINAVSDSASPKELHP